MRELYSVTVNTAISKYLSAFRKYVNMNEQIQNKEENIVVLAHINKHIMLFTWSCITEIRMVSKMGMRQMCVSVGE